MYLATLGTFAPPPLGLVGGPDGQLFLVIRFKSEKTNPRKEHLFMTFFYQTIVVVFRPKKIRIHQIWT